MLHFCDGFDSYTETADLVKHKWQKFLTYHYNRRDSSQQLDDIGAWEWSSNEGVNGGGCIKHVGAAIGDTLSVQFNYSPNGNGGRSQYSTLFWFKIATPPAEKQLLCEWYRNTGYHGYGVGLRLYVMPDGKFSFEVRRFESFVGYSDESIYTTGFSVCDNEWHCLELMVNFINTDRVLKVGLDDFILTDFVFNMTMQNYAVKQIAFLSIGVNTWIEDVIVWDEVGDSPVEMPWGAMTDTRADEFIWDWYNEKPVNGDLNNFPERGQDDFFYWMGARQISTIHPASDGTINDFDVVGAATKIDAVDDAIPTEGKYLTENQAGARMLFNLEDFQFDVSIYSVVVNALTVMDDFGSIVAHAEALNAPYFDVGIRRRISGRYEVLADGVNIVPNGGPNFVDLTGWTAYDGMSATIVDGRIRLAYTGPIPSAGPHPRIMLPVPITPGRSYMVRAQAPIRQPDENGIYGLAIGGSLVSGEEYYVNTFGLDSEPTAIVTAEEQWDAPPNMSDPTLYLTIYAGFENHSEGSVHYVDWITIEEMVPGWDFRYYQWPFRYNPVTDLEWDQASINAAEFGMRIAP